MNPVLSRGQLVVSTQFRKAAFRDFYLAIFYLAALATAPLGTTGMAASPTVGAHVLAYFRCGGIGGLSSSSIDTQDSGSTILVWIGRGDLVAFTPATVPTDNKGNSYPLLDSVHTYAPEWSISGEALYASLLAAGGTGHVFTAPMPGPGSDEITMAVIEVKNGGVIQEAQWTNVLFSPSQTSLSVTTTQAATLVAVWTGHGGSVDTAVPDNGFTKVEEILTGNCFIQVVVATKEVAEAGTYDVTWTATPTQGANLWLVAVQSMPPPTLKAGLAGENLVVSWPVLPSGYGLEMTSELSTGSAWTAVTNLPIIVDFQNTITNAISLGSCFYRLRKQ